MQQPFETVQKFGKDGVDAATRSLGALSKGFQSVAAETVDYAKRSFEEGASTAQKLAAAGSLDTAMAIQTEFMRDAYKGFVTQASRIGDLATATAKDAMSPMESLMSKAGQPA